MATAKVDNNRGEGSFGSKRSRNDAKDGDWTCPSCGNVNFSFRIVCNRGACGAPRPSPSPSPLAVAAQPVALRYEQQRPTNPYYSGAHPPVSAYGAHPPVSAYGPGPQAAELAYQHLNMRYGYPPPAYGPPSGSYAPYSSYAGTGYGPTAYLSRYSYGYRGSPLPGTASPWSGGGALADNNDNNASRKRRGGPDGAMDGDWVCPKCENRNFAFRTTCNMKKCSAPRPSELGSNNMKKEGGEVPEGSWTCTKCSNLNYPFRNVCNRKGCGNEKPAPHSNSN
ncbi:hypothetical protein LUZ60_002511 [Juncus effusus]|nr:hypothetical protein LUZ60_002511 [Juncus effusus]